MNINCLFSETCRGKVRSAPHAMQFDAYRETATEFIDTGSPLASPGASAADRSEHPFRVFGLFEMRIQLQGLFEGATGFLLIAVLEVSHPESVLDAGV